jgi:hypothetical protein
VRNTVEGMRPDTGKVSVAESYVDRLNDQRIHKGLEVGLLYIVIEDL